MSVVTGQDAREDDRYRLAATAEGGIWLLRTHIRSR